MLCVAKYDSVLVVLVESQVSGLIPIINGLNVMGSYVGTYISNYGEALQSVSDWQIVKINGLTTL